MGFEFTPGRLRMGQVSIARLICAAYRIKMDDLSGPDWLKSKQTPVAEGGAFDIEAKLPAGATADQAPLMLQAMLAERFKLTVRRESREVDTYALLVGKDGPKFQKKELLDKPGHADADGETTAFLKTIHGATKISISPGVVIRVETSNMGGLVDALSWPGSHLQDARVVDKTGLKGAFHIKMELLLSKVDKTGAPQAPVTMDATSVREFLAASQEWNAAHRDLLSAPAFEAVERLGLKLERQKNPVDTILVEHVERAPAGD